MNYLDYPKLGEAYFEHCLPNGLRIRVIPKKDFARKHAFLAVDFGSIDTKFTLDGREYRVPDGIAHYLEHKMFDLPRDNAMNLFAEVGGSPNAFTSYSMTAYYVSCTENFEENLRILLEMVMTPYFTPESVEKERGIIAQEIRMYEDSAESRVSEELFGALFAEHPVRVPIAGTVESIGEITSEMLYACHAAFYRPSNMMLCVAGDVDPHRVAELAAQWCAEAEPINPVRDYGRPETMLPAKTRSECEMEISMPTFSIGCKCEPPAAGMDAMRREIIGDLAAELLVGESSPLYLRLYEDGLIDSAFSAGYESIKDACAVTAGGDSRDPDAVLAALLEEAERVGREGFDEARFERLKRSEIGRRMRGLDSFEGICYRNCAYHFDGVDYYRFPDAYASVTAEDVKQFIAETFRPERMAMSVVYPKKQEE